MALNVTGKILYSAGFLLLLPIALVAWATAAASNVSLPVVASLSTGLPIASVGALLLLLGMRDLWVLGEGLPMNAAPPPRYVARGVYRLLPHPIYVGFCMTCAGVSIALGSASGLCLITPVMMLGCAALVLGYERIDLQERFGSQVRTLLPGNTASVPSAFDRTACYLFALAPWVAVYAAIQLLSQPITSRLLDLPFLSQSFIIACSWAIYWSAFAAIAIAPLLVRTQAELRRFTLRSLTALAFALVLFLAIPLLIALASFLGRSSDSFFGTLATLGPVLNGRRLFFPCFPVIGALLAAGIFGQSSLPLRWLARCWAALVAVSCLAIQRDGLISILSALASVALAANAARIWCAIRAVSEAIANSWREWRIGPVRIINHGLYVGLGGFIALALGDALAGPEHETAIVVAALMAVVGAALWAQFVEGSPQLLRPYGFYGGLLGGILGALAAPLFHTNVWLVLAVFSAGGTFAQGMGRLRCLVQGCCHGRPAKADIGIRYVHPRSRVCRFTNWTGLPLHPTPVYSFLWNCVAALVVLRLWSLHATLPLITGVYFILNGVGRFVEEAYRGEPQTRVIAGLRLYQWAAIASVILGALFTAVPGGTPAPDPSFRWSVLLPALAFGIFVGCAMGVDFPNSNRRFSRLA